MALFGKPNLSKIEAQIEAVDKKLARERKRLTTRGPLGLNAEGREFTTKAIAALEAERKGLEIEREKLKFGSNNVR